MDEIRNICSTLILGRLLLILLAAPLRSAQTIHSNEYSATFWSSFSPNPRTSDEYSLEMSPKSSAQFRGRSRPPHLKTSNPGPGLGSEDGPHKIGAVLSSDGSIEYFNRVIDAMEPLPPNVHFLASTTRMNPNPIITAQSVCEDLIGSASVYSVIVGDDQTSEEASISAVSYTCGFYSIPVIGISSRESSLSNKNLHGSFMRTVPPYSHQVDVWVQLLKNFDYRCAVFIHSSDSDGLASLGRFQNLADKAGIELKSFLEYSTGMFASFVEELDRVRSDSYCRVYLLAAGTPAAERIFHTAAQWNMTGEGYVWIVAEAAMRAANRPEGLIAVRLNRSSEEAHLTDALAVVALAYSKMRKEEDHIHAPPSNCSEAKSKWASGIRFYEHLRNQTLNRGMTGRVAFDENGDRLFSNYEIVNYARRPVGIEEVQVVGGYRFSWEEERMRLDLNLRLMVWPGRVRTKPPYQVVPRHLKVVTIEEKPFITRVDRKPMVLLRESDRVARNMSSPADKGPLCKSNQTLCVRELDGSDLVERYCCEGYCIDMLNKLSEVVNFTFELHLVSDGSYGVKEYLHNGTDFYSSWNGLVGDIVSKRADMVVAPLTNTPERAEVMDFSKPFKYHGITILQQRAPSRATLDSFLQPFELPLWGLVMLAVHVVAFALWILDKLSPFAKFKPPAHAAASIAYPDQVEPSLNLSSSIYFAWGILLNSGIGERVPKSFAGRVLGMVWAGFAMIVVASYTANLAAWLVIDQRDDHTLQGFDDRRLRNPVESFRFATVKSSYVENYFRHQVQYLNVHRNMEEHNVHDTEFGVESVRKGKLHAFIWDSPRLEYEAAKDCTLVTLGELIARSGYGVGLQKNSYWTNAITLAVLGLHESGFMESLDNKWILSGANECAEKNAALATKTLGLRNMAGVFILVFAGIFCGLGLIIVEIIYKKTRMRRIRRAALVRRYATMWRAEVERRKLLGICRSGYMLPAKDLYDIQPSSSSSKGKTKKHATRTTKTKTHSNSTVPKSERNATTERKNRRGPVATYPEAIRPLADPSRILSNSQRSAQLFAQPSYQRNPPPITHPMMMGISTVPRAALPQSLQTSQFYYGRPYTPTFGMEYIPPPPPPPAVRLSNTACLSTISGGRSQAGTQGAAAAIAGAVGSSANKAAKSQQRKFTMK